MLQVQEQKEHPGWNLQALSLGTIWFQEQVHT